MSFFYAISVVRQINTIDSQQKSYAFASAKKFWNPPRKSVDPNQTAPIVYLSIGYPSIFYAMLKSIKHEFSIAHKKENAKI